MALPHDEARQESKMAHQMHEEYHDPYDEWGARDILLSLIPMVVVFAFKDAALNTALAFGIAWSAGLLIFRYIWLDSRYKLIWPALDMSSVILFALLRGFSSRWYYHMHKWVPLIVPLYYVSVALHALVWRRPVTAHYARYPKFDRGGHGLWKNDKDFRRTSDIIEIMWSAVWSVLALLTLIPILTGHWYTWHALNVIFNYVIPFILLVLGVVLHQYIGSRYRRRVERDMPAGTTPEMTGRGAADPAGEVGTEAIRA